MFRRKMLPPPSGLKSLFPIRLLGRDVSSIVIIHISVFWVVTLCIDISFSEEHLNSFFTVEFLHAAPEDGGSVFFVFYVSIYIYKVTLCRNV
jgi:hypothetical protein